MKVQISVADNLMERIDKYVNENGLNRSSFASVAMIQYLNQVECVAAMRSVALSVRKMSERGNLTEEDLQKIKEFEVLAEAVTGTKL